MRIDFWNAFKVTGLLPKKGYVTAWPAAVSMEGISVLAAFDITIHYADGSEFQPDQTVQVSILNEQLANVDEVDVYHIETQGGEVAPSAQPASRESVVPTVEVSVGDVIVVVAKVADSLDVPNGKVQFGADSFSIYVVANPLATQGQTEANPYKLAIGGSLVLSSNKTRSFLQWDINVKNIFGLYSLEFPQYVTISTSGNRCTVSASNSTSIIGNIYQVRYGSLIYGYDSFYIQIIRQPIPVAITETIISDGLL